MDERGVWLIASRATAPPRAHASAQLGLTLRSVLLTPRAGFESVFASRERRSGAVARPGDGVTPYVLAALGGLALMALWLKVGSLVGVRDVAGDQFSWLYLASAALSGILIALLAQLLWGVAGAAAARVFGASTEPRALRIVWGASAFPQVLALVILLPLDFLIVGPATFTSERLEDPLASGWAALSIALSISLAIWSAFIFFRGIEVATRLTVVRTVVVATVAIASLAAIVLLAVGALALAIS